MTRIPDLREVPELPDEISQAALDGNLVLFVGAGISKLLGMPSWGEMATNQLLFLRDQDALNFSELDQLRSLDPKTQLSIAREIADEEGLHLDLTMGLTGITEGTSIYKSINDIGCVCVTTNYDELLAPRYSNATSDSETPPEVNRIHLKDEFLSKHLDTPGTVLHLHGSVSDPRGMVVTTRDYLEHYDNKFVTQFLSDLFERKTVLFIGYGLAESEILEHILRRGHATEEKQRLRFTLQGYFRSQQPLYEKLFNYYQRSFGVHVIGFPRDHKDYRQQEVIMANWATSIYVNSPPLTTDLARINEVLGSE